ELKTEASGILAWAVRGCLLWQQDGLQAPAIVSNATREYAEDSDVLHPFLTEACELVPSAEIRAGELYAHYRQWADRQGLRDRERFTATAFGRRMAARFERGVDAKGCRVYRG